jgi:hypothetical protein
MRGTMSWKRALGWLGWSEEQTLHSDIHAIMVGFAGKVKLIQAQHGRNPFVADPSVPQPRGRGKADPIVFPNPDKLPALTPSLFDAIVVGKPARRRQGVRDGQTAGRGNRGRRNS